MSKIHRKGSLESAGLKKTRLKNAKEEKVDLLFAGNVEDAVLSVRTWMEDCTGIARSNVLFNELIEDGVILCELIQAIRPGGINKKISRVKSRFAYWENFTFFLQACKNLGLQDWQLFDPEELLGQKTGNNIYQIPSERRVKNIVSILFWLALAVERLPHFSGPKLNQTPFANNHSSKNSDSTCTNHSSLSSTPNSTPSHTPEHKINTISLDHSVSAPNIEQKPNSLSCTDLTPSSPYWAEKVQDKEQDNSDPYCFTQSEVHLDDICYRTSSQQSVLSNSINESASSKKRKETLSVRVETYTCNTPSAADLVFVHDSTSSVFSPTSDNQVVEAEKTFSPNHLGNTFGAPEPIDSTGLIIDPLEFHSEVFTAGTDSQESGPQFSSPRSETTFHVNLTQTSQPDNLSISNTQLDDFTGVSSELPVITEVAQNSSPIDTFDLHHTGQISNSIETLISHSNIEYSYSQEYNDKQIQHIDNHTNSDKNHINETQQETSYRPRTSSANNRPNLLLTSNRTDYSPVSTAVTISSNSNTGYSPRTNHNNTSPLSRHSTHSVVVAEVTSDKRPIYRRYSSPQQRPGYKSAKTQIIPSENNIVQSESGSEGEIEMSFATKTARSSGKKQMRIVASNNSKNNLLFGDPRRTTTNGSNSLLNGVLTTDLHATFLPGEKHHGIILESNIEPSPRYPVVCSVEEGTPASRCGVQPGDQLTTLNDVSLDGLNIEESNLLLNKAITHRRLSLSIHRDTSNTRSYTITTTQNGDHHNTTTTNKTSTQLYPRYQSLPVLDLKRVNSDALPKHQIASTIVYTARPPTTLTPLNGVDSRDELETDSTFDMNSTAVEIGSSADTSSHHTLSSMGNDIECNTDSPILPIVGELRETNSQDSQRRVLGRSDSPSLLPTYLKDENGFNCGPGKSQSVTELSTISQLPSLHSRDQSDTGVTNYYKPHSKATKTESLPGKFRAQSLNFKESSPNRSSASTPGMGLGLKLTNMSIEDMQSVSRLQIDQIWKEVESSSNLVSPVDDVIDQSHMSHLDTIYTQTPDDWYNSDRCNSGLGENELTSSTSVQRTSSDHTINIKHKSLVGPPVRRSSSKSNEKKGIESLLTTLRSLNEKVGTYEEEEEFKLLENILQSSKFKKAKELHDNMKNLVIGELEPSAMKRISPATQYIRHFLREEVLKPSRETEELRTLLRKPDIQSTLFCYDKVATHDLYVPSTYFPRSAQDQEDIILTHSAIDLPTASLYTTREAPLSRDIPCNRKENATIVYLQRTNRPLGCAIYKDGDSVFVSKILDGCDADQSGTIKEGDELLEVNGIALIGKSNDEIIRLMSGEAGKTVSFTLIPVHDDTASLYYEEKYVRAHFSYDGLMDEEIPCKELSLNFSRGDILEISNQDDPDWWQARKVFEDGGESLPGLIPARHLQQKREVLRESHALHNAIEGKNRKKSLLSMITRKNKKKKIYYNQGPLSGAFQSVGHEVATYEDVVKLMPDPNRRRPIILIGAPSVGRRTLIKRMIELYPRHYSTCVPHITRLPRSGEIDGNDYHFITRDEMERAIQDGRFLDYMETSKGYLYGIAISSVKDVIDDGKVPVLDLLPQSLKVIGSSGLIPYVILVAAPRVERLQMTRKVTFEKKNKRLQASLSADYLDIDTRSFTESELIAVYRNSQDIQTEYGHYFDWIVVNDDLQIASDLLLEVTRRIEEEPQWVSASWVEEV